MVGALCVFGPDAADVVGRRRRDAAPAGRLRRHRARAVRAASASTRSDRLRWGLAIDAAGIGTFDWDLVTGRLTWDEQLITMFGYDAGDVRRRRIEAFNARAAPRRPAPGSTERCRPASTPAASSTPSTASSARTARPAGCTPAAARWPAPTGRAVRLLGRRLRHHRRARGRRPGHPGAGGHAGRLLQPRPRVAVHPRQRRGRAPARAAAGRSCSAGCSGTTGRPRSTASSRTATAPPSAPGVPVSFDAYYPAPLDGWYELRAWPSPDGLSVYFLEVTERRRMQERAERSAAAAGDPGPGERRAGRHAGRADGDRAPARGSSSRRWPTSASSPSSTPTGGRGTSAPGTPTRRRARCSSATPRVRLEAMPAVVAGGPRAASAASRSASAAPPSLDAAAAGRGPRPAARCSRPRPRWCCRCAAAAGPSACSPCTSAPGRRSSDDDLATAQDVADRAGPGAGQRPALQRPAAARRGAAAQPAHRAAGARPRARSPCATCPAAEAARVGGDWYDAFLQPGGATMLVIGDVVGHDTEAAAAMGQLRGLLRGIATYSDAGPAEVLRGPRRLHDDAADADARHRGRRPLRADARRARARASPGCAGPTPATCRRW